MRGTPRFLLILAALSLCGRIVWSTGGVSAHAITFAQGGQVVAPAGVPHLSFGRSVVTMLCPLSLTSSPDGTILGSGVHVTQGTARGNLLVISHNAGRTWVTRAADVSGNRVQDSVWRDHLRLPVGFLPQVVTVDDRNAHTWYIAGGRAQSHLPTTSVQHLILKSVDDGATWTSLVSFRLYRVAPHAPRWPTPNRTYLTYEENGHLVVAVRETNIRVPATYLVPRDWAPSGSINKFAQAPSDPRRLYAVVPEVGFARSIDQGRSWQVLSWSTDLTSDQGMMVVDPTDANTVYVLSTDTLGGDSRVYRSRDGGVTWYQVWTAPPSGATEAQVSATLAVTSAAVSLTTGRGVYVSHDHGAHWGQAIISPSHTLTTGALYDARLGAWYVLTTTGKLWATVDAGQHWTLLAATPGRGAEACAAAGAPGAAQRLWLVRRTLYATTGTALVQWTVTR